MRRKLVIALIILLFVIVLGYPLALAAVAISSPIPPNVGIGDLILCPDTPNCVSSLTGEAPDKSVLPLAYTGDQAVALAQLEAVLEELPRTQIMVSQGGYIHAESRSRIMRFVDDVEFEFDVDSQEIHVRSTSRLGVDDLGVNRRRVQAIREAFNAQQ
ncbi:MAG: DUF1499 domain-containing protein [Chloroflexota bacterium]